jgi:hypothetical protein
MSERDEAQGARRAEAETVHQVRRGFENEVSAQANIGSIDVKPQRGGRTQHRATQRFARSLIYSALPLPNKENP